MPVLPECQKGALPRARRVQGKFIAVQQAPQRCSAEKTNARMWWPVGLWIGQPGGPTGSGVLRTVPTPQVGGRRTASPRMLCFFMQIYPCSVSPVGLLASPPLFPFYVPSLECSPFPVSPLAPAPKPSDDGALMLLPTLYKILDPSKFLLFVPAPLCSMVELNLPLWSSKDRPSQLLAVGVTVELRGLCIDSVHV